MPKSTIGKAVGYAKKSIKKVLGETGMFLVTMSRSEYHQEISLCRNIVHSGIPYAFSFDFDEMKTKSLSFIEERKVGKEVGVYKYAPSTHKPNVYSSIYACLLLSLYGELSRWEKNKKEAWIDYLDSFQNEADGLFYDPTIQNEIFPDSDWWGARHLALHAIAAYEALGGRPKCSFRFLEKYQEEKFLQNWLESHDWQGPIGEEDDIDNKIMNVGCLLQYERDRWQSQNARDALERLVSFLESKQNSQTGMWGMSSLDDKTQLSRMVQFSYHILPLFFYDGREIAYQERLIDSILQTQNRLGGFGVLLNSSACEDIDSIDLLIRLSQKTDYRKNDIKLSLSKAFPWILANRNEDGGFVFRRNVPLRYGHEEMSSATNESSLFATWFRTLCLAYMTRYWEFENEYDIVRCPGYMA